MQRTNDETNKRADAELMMMEEADLSAKWYWSWEDGRSVEWNTYKFSDKYLLPRVREFLAELAKHSET